MLKQAFRSALFEKNTQFLFQQDISLLCNRVGLLNLTPRLLLHTNINNKEKQQLQQKQPTKQTDSNISVTEDTVHLSPSEILRKKALVIEHASSLRPRCLWLKEEDEKLLRLVKQSGKRWSYISEQFIDRSPSTIMNRYELLVDRSGRGPWSTEENEMLRTLGNGRAPEDIDNWKEIQEKLPKHRPLFLIKQKYAGSLNPHIKYGAWSEEESDKLSRLISLYGEANMTQIAAMMGNRTRRQCLERWRWQMVAVKKGRFTKEEDSKIIEAVKKYGDNFAVVCKVIGTDRTPRHVSQHYRNKLAPDIDRSPWSFKEQALVYDTCIKNSKDMVKTRKELNSKRSIRDCWNHFISHERYLKKSEDKSE